MTNRQRHIETVEAPIKSSRALGVVSEKSEVFDDRNRDDKVVMAAPKLTCRELAFQDLDAVVDLLVRGFPERGVKYWRDGLARHESHTIPDGCPRWGYVMVADETIVGVVLTLYAPPHVSAAGPRCNLSSWYVDPAFRPYATLMDRMAMRRRDTTFTNISAAPHTHAIHAARGFVPISQGQFVAAPLLARKSRDCTVETATAPNALNGLPDTERQLVIDHVSYGCICVIGRDGDGATPFVFVRHPVDWLKWRLGFSPLHYLQLVFCRSTSALAAFGRPLGLHLLRHYGAAFVIADTNGPIEGLPGRYIDGWSVRIQRGPGKVPMSDLSYSEMVVLGP